MNLLEYIESRNAEYEEFVSQNPKEAIRAIESLKVQVGELSKRIIGLNELVDVLVLGRRMTADEFKEAFPTEGIDEVQS